MPNRRKPNEQHLAEGTWKPQRHNAPEPPPDPASGVPVPIGGRLTKLERQIWNHVVASCPWLKEADSLTLFNYCKLQGQFIREPLAMRASRVQLVISLGARLALDPVTRSSCAQRDSRFGDDARRPAPEARKPGGDDEPHFDGDAVGSLH